MTGLLEKPFTEEQKQEAAQIKKELSTVLDEIHSQEQKLETNFVKVGAMLEAVREKKFWLLPEWGTFKSYNAFLESIAPKVGKGRTRLYACAGIAKQLLPYIPPEELTDIGISKASALASAVKRSGKKPSDDLLTAAKNPNTTLQQVQELIADDYGARDEGEKGVWFSLVGVFFSPEEKEEFERAVGAACQADPPLQYHVKWEDATAGQRKEILWRWIATFLAEHGA